MSAALKQASGFLFYLLGAALIVGLVLLKRDISPALTTALLNSIDLPLLLAGMVYGGSSLYISITANRQQSMTVALIITLPLALLFIAFAYANFALPFAIP